jgi:hypothetical protein
MRDRILAEIRRLALANGGQSPGRQVFEAHTGIRYAEWYGIYWARWGDAVAEAGFSPNSIQAKFNTEDLLKQVAEAYRHFGHVATDGELRLYGRSHPTFPAHSTITNHFRGKAGLLAAIREWLSTRHEYSDVAALLPADLPASSAPRRAKTRDGSVYLIQSGSHYKIGRSDELERRVKEIRVALPDAATLVHTITTDDPPGIEAYWHRRFADRRTNGEWFKLTAADVLAFKRRKFQ